MKNNRFRISTVLGFLVAMAALASGTAQAATLTTTMLNDGETVALFNPQAAQGPDGKIHVVAQGRPSASVFSSGTTDIYYMLLSSAGAVLIDATPIGAAAHQQSPPAIAITSDNKAVVTKKRNGTDPVSYMLVDPSGDDQSGDAAVPGDILEVAQTAVGVATGSGHQTVVLDSAGLAHVVWADSSSILRHLSFNPATSAVVTPEHQIGTSTVGRRRTPGVGVDSDDNLHIVYQADDVHGDAPAAYVMTDNAGAVLIAPTQLYNDQALSPHGNHFSLFVDASDIVHIVYGDKRNTLDADSWCNICYSGGTAVYTRLNPALDDQSGDAADITAIRVDANEMELGNLWYGRAYMTGGAIDFISVGNGNHGRGNFTHRRITPGSGASEPRVFDAAVGGPTYSKHYAAVAGGRVIWGDEAYSPTLTGVTVRLLSASLASVVDRPAVVINEDDDGIFGCSLSTGKAPVDPLLPLLAALAGLYLLRRRATPAA